MASLRDCLIKRRACASAIVTATRDARLARVRAYLPAPQLLAVQAPYSLAHISDTTSKIPPEPALD